MKKHFFLLILFFTQSVYADSLEKEILLNFQYTALLDIAKGLKRSAAQNKINNKEYNKIIEDIVSHFCSTRNTVTSDIKIKKILQNNEENPKDFAVGLLNLKNICSWSGHLPNKGIIATYLATMPMIEGFLGALKKQKEFVACSGDLCRLQKERKPDFVFYEKYLSALIDKKWDINWTIYPWALQNDWNLMRNHLFVQNQQKVPNFFYEQVLQYDLVVSNQDRYTININYGPFDEAFASLHFFQTSFFIDSQKDIQKQLETYVPHLNSELIAQLLRKKIKKDEHIHLFLNYGIYALKYLSQKSSVK